MGKIEKTRFDARLTREQKEFFEYASQLGGFRSLTEFIIQAAQLRAKEIIEEHNKILASNKDKEIFFDALLNPPSPNTELKSALDAYNKALENE